MERKYPTKMFLFLVLMNFLFHHIYLSVPGFILLFVGFRARPCLWAGLAILIVDLVLSIREQLRIRDAAVSSSDNPEFNKLMDALCGPGGFEAFGKALEEVGETVTPEETEEDE